MRKRIKVTIILCILIVISTMFLSGQNVLGYNLPIPCTSFNGGSIAEVNESWFANLVGVEPISGRNINSMEGLGEVWKEIGDGSTYILIGDTCISELQEFKGMEQVEDLAIMDSKIKEIDNLHDMNKLHRLDLIGNDIETISNIENLRTNTNKELIINLSDNPLKYITQESYDYARDPKNNVKIVVNNQEEDYNFYFTISSDMIDEYTEKIDEYLEVV